MQITHEEARTWVHLNSDGGLAAHQRQLLTLHLNTCAECRRYAHSIETVESVLRPLLKRQWTQQPIPLSMGALVRRENNRSTESMVLATRIAAVSVMFIAFMFSAMQFTIAGSRATRPVQANVPSMPIPSTSTKLISTEMGQVDCAYTSYIVGKNDTLAAIAFQFSISVDELIQANTLTDSTMITGQELVIPVCKSTPTVTLDPLTTTLTPVLGRITTTPGG